MENNLDKKVIWKKTLEGANIPEGMMDFYNDYKDSSKLFELDFDKKKAYIRCENFFVKEYFENSVGEYLEKSLNDITSMDFSIMFFSENELDQIKTETSPIKVKSKMNDGIISRFKFSNYIASDKNKMLVQAAHSIVLRPNAGPYNPLFVHGGPGLGKTHLLHAIGNGIKDKMPHKKVKYISSGEFSTGAVNALMISDNVTSLEQIEAFKIAYKEYDILLMDDIQYIASRKKTKEIFFEILNHYINDNKQIVITSDSPPDELNEFEKRFIDRFKKGLTLSVSPPDTKAAKAIIELKLKKEHMIEEKIFTNEAMEFIAINFSDSVRELEGVLTKLMFWNLENNLNMITLDTVISIIGNVKSNKEVSVDRIKKVICKHYGITVEELESSSRKKEIVVARHLSIYITKELLKWPLQRIGKAFGRKDHTTIMNAIYNIEKKRKIEPLLNALVSDFISDFKKG